MISTAVHAGDFSEERIALLAVIPDDELEGSTVRAIHLLAGEDLRNDPSNFWVFQLGRMKGGDFRAIAASSAFPGGFSANVVKKVPYSPAVAVSRGDLLACKLTPSGLPPPLVGLSVVVEWGIL